MGGSVSRILSGLLWTKKEIRILILGLVWMLGTLWRALSKSSTGRSGQDYAFVPAKGLLLESLMSIMRALTKFV